MARVPSSVGWHQLDALFRGGTHCGLTDSQLLERFVAGEVTTAELAFAALVARHGPMVLGTCRRALHNSHDAADAFQATFLVLVRKAGALRVEGSLGPWLHGVSRRIALQARKSAARRAALETGCLALVAVRPCDPDRSEICRMIDEEISRLPANYRKAIVLCDLEGLTHEAAARQLGCPPGTVASRLSRGRERMRERLLRRGLGPLASVIPASPAPAPVPPNLAASLVRAAVEMVAGGSFVDVVPAAVGSLTVGALRAFTISRIRVAAALLAICPVVIAGAALGNRSRAGEPGRRMAQQPGAPLASPRAADELMLTGRTAYDANSLTKIRPRFNGTAEKVHAGIGESVKNGAPLVDLFSTELAAAKTDLQTAFIQWQRDLATYTRREILFKNKAIAAQVLTDSRNEESKSRLAFETAREKLMVFGVPEEQITALTAKRPGLPIPNHKQDDKSDDKPRLTLLSPVDGVIIARDVVPGNLYGKNDVLFVISPLDHLTVWAHLPNDERGRVKEGQACSVEIPYLDQKIASKVDYISEPIARKVPSTCLVRIRLPNPDGRLKADMLVRVRVLRGEPAANP